MSENLEIIRKTVRKYFDNAEIFLFGSRAKGTASSNSDYDILIITDNEILIKEKLIFRTNIRKELHNFNIRTDILIQSRQEIEIKKNLKGHIIRSILTDCIEL